MNSYERRYFEYIYKFLNYLSYVGITKFKSECNLYFIADQLINICIKEFKKKHNIRNK